MDSSRPATSPTRSRDVCDFLILIHWAIRVQGAAMNLVSSCRRWWRRDGVLGCRSVGLERLLGVVAASMIYVAVADLTGLHRRPSCATRFQASDSPSIAASRSPVGAQP